MKVLIVGISVPLVVLTFCAIAIGIFILYRFNGKKLHVEKNDDSQKNKNRLPIEKTLNRRVSFKAIMTGNVTLPLVDEFEKFP